MSSSAPPPPPSDPTGPGYQPPTPPPTQPPAGGGYPATPPAGSDYSPPQSTPPTSAPGGASPTGTGSRPNPLEGMHQYDLGLLAAGVLIFVLSFLPFYTVDVIAVPSGNAWDSFWSWFAVLLGLAATAMILLPKFGVNLPVPSRLVALGCWALALLCLVIALFTWPYSGEVPAAQKDAFDEATGHGFGLYASLLVAAIATALAFMRKDAADDATVR